MNNQEAQLILQAYRPGGQDASDPLFAEALERAQRDPALQKWLAEENALDARVREKLQTAIPIPPELKSNLLAQRKIVRLAPWYFQPVKLAAAAAVVLLLGLAASRLLPQKQAQLVAFRSAMANYSLTKKEHIVFTSHDITQVQEWLQGQGIKADFELPAALRRSPTHGCRLVDWNGRKGAMICFFVNGEHTDLFVMDGGGLPGLPENGAPQFAEAGGMTTVAWAKAGKIYLLSGKDKKTLQNLFQPA